MEGLEDSHGNIKGRVLAHNSGNLSGGVAPRFPFYLHLDAGPAAHALVGTGVVGGMYVQETNNPGESNKREGDF